MSKTIPLYTNDHPYRARSVFDNPTPRSQRKPNAWRSQRMTKRDRLLRSDPKFVERENFVME